eukprot:46369_1
MALSVHKMLIMIILTLVVMFMYLYLHLFIKCYLSWSIFGADHSRNIEILSLSENPKYLQFDAVVYILYAPKLSEKYLLEHKEFQQQNIEKMSCTSIFTLLFIGNYEGNIFLITDLYTNKHSMLNHCTDLLNIDSFLLNTIYNININSINLNIIHHKISNQQSIIRKAKSLKRDIFTILYENGYVNIQT